jgi:glycogen synthase
MATILEGERVGVALEDFSEASMQNAISRLLQLSREPDIDKRCRQVAQDYFSLETGVKRYNRIYLDLLGGVTLK